MRIRQERIPTLVTVLSLTLLALSPTSYGEVVEADIPSGDLGEDGKSCALVMSLPADRQYVMHSTMLMLSINHFSHRRLLI
jgi:hypothetical protein